MIYVVGSGPAGVSCASALLDRGLDVTMLDTGLTLEERNRDAVRRMARTDPAAWNPADATLIRSRMIAKASGIPLKYVFGSDFPYAGTRASVPMDFRGAFCSASFARGGLSQVWGSTILPYTASDIAGWPVSVEELAPHYAAVMKLMPFSAAHDDLDAVFPHHAERCGDLPLSEQAAWVKSRMENNREALREAGILFGKARLALRAPNENGCRLCGGCMYGCVYGQIYCADQTLEALLKRPGFRYVDGVRVDRVENDAASVVLTGERLSNGEAVRFEGARVFLAAGLLSTTRILAESLPERPRSIRFASSQAFLLPVWTSHAASNVEREALHTLSQLYLRLRAPEISAHNVQLQLYSYNDLFPMAIRESLAGALMSLLPGVERAMLSRLQLVQGFLHSDESDPIVIDIPDRGGPWRLSGQVSAPVKARVNAVARRLFALRRQTGLTPVLPMLRFTTPGQSFHNAGTFPMSASPGALQSDVWGRPAPFDRVHAVDGSVLPSSPAPTITLSIMANAHRIATRFPEAAA